MLGLPSDAITPFHFSHQDPTPSPLQHAPKPPIARVFVSWAGGNLLRVACLLPESKDDEDGGGKVVEVRMGGGDGEIGEAGMRRVVYGSVPAFAVLQSRRNAEMVGGRTESSLLVADRWQYILDYSMQIKALLGGLNHSRRPVIEDPRTVLEPLEDVTNLKAAWELMEIFYADKQSWAWLPERLLDWLAEYDSLITRNEPTTYSKLIHLQKKLANIQIVEDDPEYWEGVSSALAVGWLDIVVKLLRLHGSYQPDQLDSRETENGLVEAVGVLISSMPRMRSDLPDRKLGKCYKSKPDFIKAWEKWRGHIAKLDCSAFWVQCSHRRTRDGLKNMLQIMQGNVNSLTASTFHWMELYISHFLYLRPLTTGLDGLYNLAQKCTELKSKSDTSILTRLLLSILGENTEVVLAECSKTFGPWMVVHAIELLATESHQSEVLLHEERYNLGGISIEELHRLIYAQVLSSHALTWQIAPTYLASCPNQGLGLLEILLYKQPVEHYKLLLKNLEICRLYELENISSSIMKIAGIHHWKHGRKGAGIYWLQKAGDEILLSRISQKIFDSIGNSISDTGFKQWEGLIELLGSDVGKAGGLEFLHKYRDFKRSLQQVEGSKSVDAAQQAVEYLIQLVKSPATPQRFWLTLLHDSVKLLNWPGRPLINVSQTNLLLSKLQELSMASLRPDYVETVLPAHTLSSVRLALATNLGRAILEE